MTHDGMMVCVCCFPYNDDPCVCFCVGECMSPLGMESGEITEDRIKASSQYNPSWSPLRSRLNYPDNGWTPSEDSAREWIEVYMFSYLNEDFPFISILG